MRGPVSLCGVLLGLLTACTMAPRNVEDLARPEQQRVLHGELVHDMLAQGRSHAALAHLEELRRQQGKLTADQRLLRAEAHYRIGELGEASADYTQLLQTTLAGQAWHGLGRIHTPTDLRKALQAYNNALEQRPTDAAIRNDLGYALLLGGRVLDACRHLRTAHELDPQQARIIANLLLCEAALGRHDEVERMMQVQGFTPAERQQHQRQYEQLRATMVERKAELLAAPTGVSDDPSAS